LTQSDEDEWKNYSDKYKGPSLTPSVNTCQWCDHLFEGTATISIQDRDLLLTSVCNNCNKISTFRMVEVLK
jgi:hypothetical protein